MTGTVAPADQAPANSDTGSAPPPDPTFTQAQVNAMMANTKRDALKDMPTSDELAKLRKSAADHQAYLDGQKPDLERLTQETASWKSKHEDTEKASKAKDVVIERQHIAADAKLPSKFWKFIEGDTAEDIKTSVAGLLDTLGLTTDAGQGGTGGRPPAPNPQQGSGSAGGATGTMAAGRAAYKALHEKQE